MSFLFYNPGTERAHTIFRIAGNVGDGMLIRNLTTGQRCKIVNLTDESLLPGAHLELDSRMGQTRIALGDSRELAFAMHDEGYIELAPCTPFERSIAISHTEDSNIITSDGPFLPYMAGQFLYLDGWKKIRQITDAHSAILSDKAASSGTTSTPIVMMNEIEISGENLALTMLEEVRPRDGPRSHHRHHGFRKQTAGEELAENRLQRLRGQAARFHAHVLLAGKGRVGIPAEISGSLLQNLRHGL